jgi:hypothetical protein
MFSNLLDHVKTSALVAELERRRVIKHTFVSREYDKGLLDMMSPEGLADFRLQVRHDCINQLVRQVHNDNMLLFTDEQSEGIAKPLRVVRCTLSLVAPAIPNGEPT